MRVELDIFSGRPNPAWPLDAKQARALLLLLRDPPSPPPEPRGGEGLGYRGLLVTTQPDQDAVEGSLTIRDGWVVLTGPQGSWGYRDDDRTIERWLLETGRPWLDADLLKEALTAVGGCGSPPP